MKLKPGSWISCSGIIGIARDRGLQRLCAEKVIMPNILFLAGPTLKGNSALLGSCGPTSISRMVPFLKICHELGTQLIIAKGINDNVVATMREIGIAYGIAPGGTGAFYGVRISRVLERRYEELGPESFFIVEVEDFPFFVSVGGEVDGHFEQIQ